MSSLYKLYTTYRIFNIYMHIAYMYAYVSRHLYIRIGKYRAKSITVIQIIQSKIIFIKL